MAHFENLERATIFGRMVNMVGDIYGFSHTFFFRLVCSTNLGLINGNRPKQTHYYTMSTD